MTGDHIMDGRKHSRTGEETYLCQKTGRRIPANAARCPKPKEPCKYRLDCIIYALYKDAQRSGRLRASRAERCGHHRIYRTIDFGSSATHPYKEPVI